MSTPVGVRHRTGSLSIPTGAPGNGTTQEFGPSLGGDSCTGLVGNPVHTANSVMELLVVVTCKPRATMVMALGSHLQL